MANSSVAVCAWGAEPDRQLSHTGGVRGQTWGSERGGVWVVEYRASLLETCFGGANGAAAVDSAEGTAADGRYKRGTLRQ